MQKILLSFLILIFLGCKKNNDNFSEQNKFIYIATATDGKLHCVNAETGDTKWTFSASGFMYSSPATDGKNVYFGAGDGYIYAVSSTTGEQKWSFKTEKPIFTSPALKGNVLYCGSLDGNAYALDKNTGQPKWIKRLGTQINGSPLLANGIVYMNAEDRSLEFPYSRNALDENTGDVLWQSVSTAYFGNSCYSSGMLAASINSDIWVVSGENGYNSWSVRGYGMGLCNPTGANGRIYVADNKLYSFDAVTGQEKWSKSVDRISSSMTPFVNGEVAVIFSENGKGYAFNAIDGTPLWENNFVNPIVSSPVVANGKVYVGVGYHGLVALDLKSGKTKWTALEGNNNFRTAPCVIDKQGQVFHSKETGSE